MHLFTIVSRVACSSLIGYLGASLHCINDGVATEPSCGIGNFLGMLPETLSGANLYGVELDGLTGRIAKQLYQKANIAIDGFEGLAE